MIPAPDGERRRATYEDVLEAPEHLVAEILDGELVTSPRPAVRHSMATAVLASDVVGPYHLGRGGPGGWWILFGPEVHFGPPAGVDVVVPDLAGWRRERMPHPPGVPYLTLAPDWICEVLSPSTARYDRIRKLRIYAREGVGHAWLVDPLAKTVEVYRREGGHWLLLSSHEGSERMRAEPFDAVEIELSALWGEDGQEPEGT